MKDQHKAVTDFLSDTLSADMNGATLNLRFLAPTPEILDTALKIQSFDKVLAHDPEPDRKVPGALEFAIVHMVAEAEKGHEAAGHPLGTAHRDFRERVVRLYVAQEQALERGAPAPDESELLDELTADGMKESSARALLSYGGARRAMEAEQLRAQSARQSAQVEREQLHAHLAALMAGWVATPPG
ncbi:hypothetical protein [Streptomyces microflavus]|uniref:hypothetical protein n=1 Tax=Streptomyces microflavus TaxID=1919 RepID=UPI0036603D08